MEVKHRAGITPSVDTENERSVCGLSRTRFTWVALAVSRDWAVTPKELSHHRSPGWGAQPGHLLARLARNLITSARMIPILNTWSCPKGAMRNTQSSLQQSLLTDLTPWRGILGGFLDLTSQVGYAYWVPKVKRCLTYAETQSFAKKFSFGSGFLRPVTPKPVITVDQAIKSKQRNQKMKEIYHKPYLYNHWGGVGGALL